MIDVFLNTITKADDNTVRRAMYKLCLTRWGQEPGIFLRYSPCLGVDKVAFQRQRRVDADRLSESDIYVVADDDCLPMRPEPFVEAAVKIMRRHEDFAVISVAPTGHDFERWTPEASYWKVRHTEDVGEEVSVGQIRFCRKGAMKEWPPMLPGVPGYDMIHADTLRKYGFRSGFFKKIFCHHIGRFYSHLWPNPPVEYK
jgi:hypothetical protein